ncbi:MAG: short chain dehydrogenase [Myxococcota bacterium]
MKRIAIVGASGTIGAAVARALEERGDEVIRLSRRTSPPLDLEDGESVARCLQVLGLVNALVCTAGRARFGRVLDASDATYELGLFSKLMGQIRLVRLGAPHLVPGGAIVLTSGLLAHRAIPGTAPVALVNAALETFVRTAAQELDTVRLGVVSPPMVLETAVAQGRSLDGAAPARAVAETYLAVVDGSATGATHFVDKHSPS